VILSENENQLLLDAGFMDVQRKLFYREMVARFSHHLGVVWNMGEENGPAPWYDDLGQTHKQRLSMAEYLRSIDPYKNLLVFHTLSEDPELNDYTEVLLNNTNIDGLSMQVSNVYDIHRQVKKWITKSGESGQQWVVHMDEIGPWYTGLRTDADDPNHDTIRTQALWGALMAGAAGTEWYCGLEDLTMEDFRSRENMWKQTKNALELFRSVPFHKMESNDDLVVKGNAWSFAKPGSIYMIYIYGTDEVVLDSRDMTRAQLSVQWYDPKEGRLVTESSHSQLNGRLTLAPPSSGKDWLVIIRDE
jgi:hypothetical protein